MQIVEEFHLDPDRLNRLFWLDGYVRLSQEVYQNYRKTGELSEAARHLSNCASRWGISRKCAEALLEGTATYELSDNAVTVTRTFHEE